MADATPTRSRTGPSPGLRPALLRSLEVVGRVLAEVEEPVGATGPSGLSPGGPEDLWAGAGPQVRRVAHEQAHALLAEPVAPGLRSFLR